MQAKHILVATEKEAKDIINELKDLKGKELDANLASLLKRNQLIQVQKTKVVSLVGLINQLW